MARRKHSRIVIGLAIAGIVLAGLGYAFWPRPQLIDIGTAERGPMRVTIDEEGRTRVHETYVVSTPITGRLMRVEVEAGDTVARGDTVVPRRRRCALPRPICTRPGPTATWRRPTLNAPASCLIAKSPAWRRWTPANAAPAPPRQPLIP